MNDTTVPAGPAGASANEPDDQVRTDHIAASAPTSTSADIDVEDRATDVENPQAQADTGGSDAGVPEQSPPAGASADDRADASADDEVDDQADDQTEDPADEEDSGESAEQRLQRLEEEGDIAADYLEELLDIADLDGDIDIDVDGDRASVEVRGATQLARLNKPGGELMDALQELARLAVQTRTGNRSRLMLDIGGFRARHRLDLEDLAEKAVTDAKSAAEPVPMRPMNPFERKVVHDVAKREGLHSESEGDGKGRHVVIYPAS